MKNSNEVKARDYFKQGLVTIKSNIKKSAIEFRINLLKEKLAHIQSEYVLEIYKVVKEIYFLRKKQFPRYNLYDLSREKGMNFKQHHIYYICMLDFVSKKTAGLIKERKIKATSVIRILYKSAVFRKDMEMQDAVIERYMAGQLSLNNIVRFPLNSLLTFVMSKEHIPTEQKGKLVTIYSMRGTAKKIDKYRDLLEQPKNKKKLIQNFNQLKTAVSTIEDVNYKCPYCKKKIKLSQLKQNGKM